MPKSKLLKTTTPKAKPSPSNLKLEVIALAKKGLASYKELSQKTVPAIAAEINCPSSTLSNLLFGKGDLGLEMAMKILAALGKDVTISVTDAKPQKIVPGRLSINA
jgi:hypothetical protein